MPARQSATIKLRQHARTPEVKAFFADYEALTFDNPLDPRERVWSYASDEGERMPLILTALSFTPHHAAPVWFETISSPEGRGKGQASYVLREIARLADKHGVAIWLTPKPFGKFDNSLKLSDLKAWYTRHGWVPQGSAWVRQPITSRVAGRVASNVWYHITDKANFRLNPKYAPKDNSISIEDRSGRAGIYLARDIEPWLNGHGYWRPFVAEFEVDPTVKGDPGVHGRWGGEMFVPAASFDKLHIERVIPLDAWARERYGDFGWVEEQVGRRFDTGDAIQFGTNARPLNPPKGYRYLGPDVRQMPPEDVKRLKSDIREFRRTRTSATQVAARVASRWIRNATSACNPRGVSYAWVDPNGKVHPTQHGHEDWAWQYVRRYPDMKQEAELERDAGSVLLFRGWVRFANFTNIGVWSDRTPSSAAWRATAELVVGCAVSNHDVDVFEPLVYIDEMEAGGKAEVYSVSDFVERYADRSTSDRMFDMLMARR